MFRIDKDKGPDFVNYSPEKGRIGARTKKQIIVSFMSDLDMENVI